MSIDVEFYAFNEKKADPTWGQLRTEGIEALNAVSSEAFDQLDEYCSGHDKVFRPAILNTLALIDLELGSETARVTIDEPRRMEGMLGYLLRVFVPERFVGFTSEWFQAIPTDDMVLMYQRLSVDKVRAAVDLMPDDWLAQYEIGSREYLGAFAQRTVEFAFQLRPVVAACKRTGAQIVMAVNNEPDDTLLLKRAETHLSALSDHCPGLADRLTDAT